MPLSLANDTLTVITLCSSDHRVSITIYNLPTQSMLKPVVLSKRLSTRSLLEIWVDRYKLDAFMLISGCTGNELIDVIEEKGRNKTFKKAHKWIKISSEFAGLKTNSLFSYIPNVVSLEEARQIAGFVEKIYTKLLDVYQQQQVSSEWVALIDSLNNSNSVIESLEKASSIDLLVIEQVAIEIEPLILALQNQHLACQDRRTIGFMSTQFHFSTQLLLSRLQPIEQLLLKPYLQFVEEQVCIPWQRICAAANRHFASSPVITAVKSMLPQSEEISSDIYSQALTLFPTHRSRRGLLTQPEVAASSVRDMSMFQAYLWLCVLEGNMSSVENELLPLCLMVFPAISVDWEITQVAVELMTTCIQKRLDVGHMAIVEPYMHAMKQLFIKAKSSPELLEQKVSASI